MLTGVVDAKTQHHYVNKAWGGQIHPFTGEVFAHMEDDFINANGKRIAFEQRFIYAAILVGTGGSNEFAVVAFNAVHLTGDVRSWFAMHCVKHVGSELSHLITSFLVLLCITHCCFVTAILPRSKNCQQFVLTIFADGPNNCQQNFGNSYRILEMVDQTMTPYEAPAVSGIRPEKSVWDNTVLDGEPQNEVERIYAEIFDAVIDQRLLPGVKLTESVLCDVFHCSRGMVRAALARLAHDKIVELLPNRGAFVATPDIKETHDIFEARRMVESSILEKLVQMPDLEQRLAPLRRLVAQERDAFNHKDRVSWIRLSNFFHVKLAQLAENSVLTDLMRELTSRTSLIIALYDEPGRSACSFDEHDTILDCLVRRDHEAALLAMRHHLQDCERRLKMDNEIQSDLKAVFSFKR